MQSDTWRFPRSKCWRLERKPQNGTSSNAESRRDWRSRKNGDTYWQLKNKILPYNENNLVHTTILLLTSINFHYECWFVHDNITKIIFNGSLWKFLKVSHFRCPGLQGAVVVSLPLEPILVETLKKNSSNDIRLLEKIWYNSLRAISSYLPWF